ncbi:MAG TPA: hypothetical protein VF468_28280 [Actinomycetota bacterium]|nr:hypothetical protein [Actinomycetota bacterium]
MTRADPLELSSRPPEFWDPHRPPVVDEHGILHVFSYDHVERVLVDPVFSSSGITALDYHRIHPASGGLWMADGRRRQDMRTIGAAPFRQPQLGAWAPGICDIAEDLLAATLARDGNRIDLVADYARPLHLGVICLLLGIPTSHAGLLDTWVRRAAEATNVAAVPPEPEEVSFLAELLDRRRQHPQHGLVDALLALQTGGYLVEGRRLRDEDLIGHLAMLVHAGWEAPAAIANLIVFAEDVGLLDRLPDDPQLLAGTIEEILRSAPPFPAANARPSPTPSSAGTRSALGNGCTAG